MVISIYPGYDFNKVLKLINAGHQKHQEKLNLMKTFRYIEIANKTKIHAIFLNNIA